ncbi:mfs multidrug transporter [Diplodia corticola]|uniref:Mfs multidrug transporter n=1 Tax=Diplodia corticola TaxID=236234 RepID=A0A1J9QKP3_9PEZI|nr:mfs multidrug transporter [Diplodia corticola]OJD29041.1 mfs multidrug transporter [Diplodia corticola]
MSDNLKSASVDEVDRSSASGLHHKDTHDSRYIEEAKGGPGEALSEAHQEYLLARHGRLDLQPVPDMTDADPYNWPKRKALINLILVAFHAMMATFTAAAIQSAFADIAIDLNVSLQRASYLTSLVIAILGAAPLFWRPLSDRYGRRPIFLLSLICSLIGNAGCAKSPSYATMGLCRAITAFFISPAGAIGSAVVQETFFKHERAKFMGVWTLFVTLGVPTAPFIFGFVALRVGYRWIYWILACTNAVQLLLYTFLGPETRYIRTPTTTPSPPTSAPSFTRKYLTFTRLDPTPLTLSSFLSPLHFFAAPRVLVPTLAYATTFLFASILISIEIPQIFVEKFHLNTQAIGLQNLSLIIGSVIGEQMGGRMSDWWMQRRRKRTGGSEERPEFRLWLSYGGYLLAIAGVVVFLVQTGAAREGRWNITPVIGAAVAAVGNQIVTTVLITYAVDCYREEAAGVGVFVTFVRQTWGFIGPFWFPDMLENVGLYGSAGICTALIVGISMIPTVFLQWKGHSWR